MLLISFLLPFAVFYYYCSASPATAVPSLPADYRRKLGNALRGAAKTVNSYTTRLRQHNSKQ